MAQAYCNWLSLKSQRKVFIPTVKQWERVARGKTGYKYPWGNEIKMDALIRAIIGKKVLKQHPPL